MRALFSAVGSRLVAKCATALAFLLLLSTSVWAQQPGGILGTVKDAAGSGVAGVKVEAASPALTEKTRTVVTDGNGRYTFANLPVGKYDVTFSAAGFSTVKTVGIDLPAAFTATVNGDLKAGSPAETITVTATPVTDTRTTGSATTVSADALAAAGQSADARGAAATTAGVRSTATNSSVGGGEAAAGQRTSTVSFHGKSNLRAQFDGLRTGNFEGSGTYPAYTVNTAMIATTAVQGGGGSVEYASPGAAISMLPKSGTNTWAFSLAGSGMTDALSTDNLTEEKRKQLGDPALDYADASSSKALYRYDVGWTSGGPIRRNKIWIFQSNRYFGSKSQFSTYYFNKTQGTTTYTPDLTQPAYRKEWTIDPAATRLTWQMTPRNKFNFHADLQKVCTCMGNTTGGAAPESIAGFNVYPTGGFIVSWSAPVSSKLLLEAGYGAMLFHWPTWVNPAVKEGDVSILEQTTNSRFNSPAGADTKKSGYKYSDRFNQRFTASYTTGAHALKFGFQNEQARQWQDNGFIGVDSNGVSYVFREGKPSQVVEYALPYFLKNNGKAEIGLFGQDTWNIKRVTLTGGVRFDNFVGEVPAQTAAKGPYAYSLPAREYAAVKNVPNWKDFTTRVGMSYDVFGNGRTALRANLGKYMPISGNTATNSMNPITQAIVSTTRTWTDDGDFVPECDFANPQANGECAQLGNAAFGGFNPRADRLADDVLRGVGKRVAFWDYGFEISQRAGPSVNLSAGYYHNFPTAYLVTDNLNWNPNDFTPYCFTAPTDPRLGANSGAQICGQYDISRALSSQISNQISQASNVTPDERSGYKVVLPSAANCGYQDPGNQTGSGRTNSLAYDTCGVNTFVNFGLTARLPRAITAGFSVDAGTTNKNTCFIVDSPQQMKNCDQTIPWINQTDIRANATFPLPYAVTLSANYQDGPGAAIYADYAVTSKDITFAGEPNRTLASCSATAAKATCAATANVALLDPYSQFLPRRRQLDLRFAKNFRLGTTRRLNVAANLGNVMNANDTTQLTTAYGKNWLKPITMQGQRQVNLSGTLSF